ncbi:preprotein translocase subunit SecG [Patescibacteria group bacterium]|nr:preprotein translocase subunit SecG [Patescibacteria group bacterium]
MSVLTNILPIIQIIISVIIIVAILLQQRGGGLGSAFGGGGDSYHTKRGFEKILFRTTIIASILFAVTSIVALLLK